MEPLTTSRVPRAIAGLAFVTCGILAARAAPAAAPCRLEEGTALFEARKFPDARRALEPCAATDAKASLYVGRAWLAQNDFEHAIPAFEKAVALEPKSSDAHMWLGRAMAQKAAKANVFQQASLAGKIHKEFDQAVVLDPASVEARLSLMDFYLLAPGIMGGSVAKAQEQAAEIRRRDPLKGYQAAGKIAENEKHFDAAEAEYEKAQREFPQRKEPYFWRASLAAKQKQYGRGFDILESLLKAMPGDETIYFTIGRYGAQTGERLDRAEECLKRYLQHEPGKDEPALSSTHFQLGVLYDKKGDRQSARREWQQALTLDPEHSGAKEALAKK
ncbi:MAG TPA: tetratricopeptide repeat protein [Thermoanaerobaculia bacterium]|nr:tetratricopeptide repeat protein [Thermoanaerobaculia bacterium]